MAGLSHRECIGWVSLLNTSQKVIVKVLVEFTNHTKIQNNKNMLVFGVAYDFSKGKNNEIDKKLENSGGSAVNF